MQPWKYVLIGMVIGLSTTSGHAGDGEVVDVEQMRSYVSPQGFFSYYDFRFNSTAGDNYSRYNGHSKLYGLAGNGGVIKKE